MAVDQFEALSQRARQALADGNAALARQYYLQALGLRSDSPDAHYGMATACFLLSDLPGAAYHFKEVTRLDPLRAGGYVNLGAVYNRLDQFDEAIKTLRRAIQLDPKRAEAYYNLGLVYRRQGQAELAIQAYREATRLNPRMSDAHFNLANLLLEMGRYSQAILSYKATLEITPNFEKAQHGLKEAETALRGANQFSRTELMDSSKPGAGKPIGTATEPTPVNAAASTDLNRVLDPIGDGQVLSALHQATIDSENFSRNFLKILEKEVEPAIKDLSSSLLYPNRSPNELGDRVQRFEAALQNMQKMQKNLQHTMKKLRQISDRLLGGAAAV